MTDSADVDGGSTGYIPNAAWLPLGNVPCSAPTCTSSTGGNCNSFPLFSITLHSLAPRASYACLLAPSLAPLPHVYYHILHITGRGTLNQASYFSSLIKPVTLVAEDGYYSAFGRCSGRSAYAPRTRRSADKRYQDRSAR